VTVGDIDGGVVGFGVVLPGRYVGSNVGEAVGASEGTLEGFGVGS